MIKKQKLNIRKKSWWNCLIKRNKKVLEQLRATLFKPKVPHEQIVEHDQAMQEAEKLANLVATFDSKKFDNPEFIILIKTKHKLEREKPGYEGLENSAKLLEAALQIKDSLVGIEEIEFQYRGFVQQDFYQKVFSLLSQNLSQSILFKMLERLAKESQEKLRKKEGKIAIQTYIEKIKSLTCEHQLGIQLFYDLKRNQFEDFTKLQKLSDLIKEFHLQEVHSKESFLLVVKKNYELFKDLENIIRLPSKKNIVKKYAIILQYLVLLDKHKRSYRMLEELLQQLQKWYKIYQRINAIRQHYHSKYYKQPSAFKQPIPGLEFYKKYQYWLLQSVIKYNSKAKSAKKPKL